MPLVHRWVTRISKEFLGGEGGIGGESLQLAQTTQEQLSGKALAWTLIPQHQSDLVAHISPTQKLRQKNHKF